jgi:hypothetical protein
MFVERITVNCFKPCGFSVQRQQLDGPHAISTDFCEQVERRSGCGAESSLDSAPDFANVR